MQTDVTKKYWFSYNSVKGLIGNVGFGPATVQTNNTLFECDTLDEIETEIIRLGFGVPDSIEKIRTKWIENCSNQQRILGQTDIARQSDWGKTKGVERNYQLSEAESVIVETQREALRDIQSYSNPSDPALLALFNYDTWGVREDRILRIKNIKGWWSVKI